MKFGLFSLIFFFFSKFKWVFVAYFKYLANFVAFFAWSFLQAKTSLLFLWKVFYILHLKMEHRFYMTHSCISNEYLVVCTYFKKDLTDLLQVCMMYSGGKITKKCNLEKMGCLFFWKNVLPTKFQKNRFWLYFLFR